MTLLLLFKHKTPQVSKITEPNFSTLEWHAYHRTGVRFGL